MGLILSHFGTGDMVYMSGMKLWEADSAGDSNWAQWVESFESFTDSFSFSAGTAFHLGVCDTAHFGIDPIPSKYRASIADTSHFKKHKFKWPTTI